VKRDSGNGWNVFSGRDWWLGKFLFFLRVDKSPERLHISRDFAADDVGDFHERERERERNVVIPAELRGEIVRCGSLGVP